jgi:putative chromate ion transporter
VTGFGGPVALCGLMERDLVERRRWLDKLQMRDVIAVCQTMPGPLAVQVAIFVGYLHCGFWGAWAGGWALILPASGMVALLATAYVHLHGVPWLTAIIYGVSPAVIALILQSWWRLVRLGIEDRFQYAIARYLWRPRWCCPAFSLPLSSALGCSASAGIAYKQNDTMRHQIKSTPVNRRLKLHAASHPFRRSPSTPITATPSPRPHRGLP